MDRGTIEQSTRARAGSRCMRPGVGIVAPGGSIGRMESWGSGRNQLMMRTSMAGRVARGRGSGGCRAGGLRDSGGWILFAPVYRGCRAVRLHHGFTAAKPGYPTVVACTRAVRYGRTIAQHARTMGTEQPRERLPGPPFPPKPRTKLGGDWSHPALIILALGGKELSVGRRDKGGLRGRPEFSNVELAHAGGHRFILKTPLHRMVMAFVDQNTIASGPGGPASV